MQKTLPQTRSSSPNTSQRDQQQKQVGPQNRRQFVPREAQPPKEKTAAQREHNEEDARATLWELAPHNAKIVAVRVAGLDAKRARDPLLSFTAVERERIATELAIFVTRLEVLIKCARKTSMH
jgi:hypothetical protein